MRALQKLVRNGRSTGINIPRPILITLGWLPGENVVIEVLEDHSIRVRRPVAQDTAPLMKPRLIYDELGTVR